MVLLCFMPLRNRRRPPRAKARGEARNVVEKCPTGLDLIPCQITGGIRRS